RPSPATWKKASAQSHTTSTGTSTPRNRHTMTPRHPLLIATLALLIIAGLAPEGAAAKGGRVVCHGSKVAVTVGKGSTCRPLAKAIPRPQAIDARLGYLQEVLRFDVSKLGGRKAKRTRTLQSGFGAAGKRAEKKLLKGLPKDLALLDRLRSAN